MIQIWQIMFLILTTIIEVKEIRLLRKNVRKNKFISDL